MEVVNAGDELKEARGNAVWRKRRSGRDERDGEVGGWVAQGVLEFEAEETGGVLERRGVADYVVDPCVTPEDDG